MTDKNCLSYWFPLLEQAGLPVPRTWIVRIPDDLVFAITKVLYNEKPDRDPQPFFEALRAACHDIGLPAFLRTGHTSYKHSWRTACYVADAAKVGDHVMQLAEFSELADMMGMPYNVWAVREMLPTIAVGVCPAYGDFPVVREFRAFVHAGAVVCIHPYWPVESLEEGGMEGAATYYEVLRTLRKQEHREVIELACAASRAVDGEWSVDILETKRGWYITDMAEANASYHWPDCPNADGLNIVPSNS